MSCNKMLNAKGETITVYTANTRYTWMTGWMLCHGMAEVDALMNARNIDGSWQGKPCYQTAAVLPEYPDSPTVFTDGSYVTSAGFTHFRETLGLTNKYWIRFGVAASNVSGPAIGSANVELQISHAQCGSQVGMGKIVVNAGQFTTDEVVSYFELGGWTATIGFDKVMAAFVVMDNESTYMEYQLVCRTANDPRAPNAWQTCEAGYANPAAGNSVRNSTALSAPGGANITSNMLVQFGVAVRKKASAAGNPRAEINVVVARSNG